jgi:hypothetical protein
MDVFVKVWREVRKQVFSFVGSVVSVVFYVYNLFKPTSFSLASQSALSGGGSLIVSLGTLSMIAFLMFVTIGVYRWYND